MEESEQRRERLKAMRSEAAGAAVDANSELSACGGLSNPLVECQSTSTPTQYFSPRFDFYTDPMAAFSGTRRRDNITPHLSHNILPRPMYQGMTSDAAYQNPGINSPDQRKFQVPGAHFNQRPLWRPMELATPSNTPQGNPPNTWGGPGRPFNNAYLSGRPQGNPPNDWGGPGGAFNYPSPSNMPRGSKFGNPSFGQEGSYYGRGRGQRYNSSSHYESGRGGNRYPDSGRGSGRSLSNSTSPVSRMSARRGGSHESVSAEVRPDLYYRKEMVEDPWKMLTPVIWKDTHADKSWLPKSLTLKKAKVSTEFPQTSISQPSLAEYLASSFSESTTCQVREELAFCSFCCLKSFEIPCKKIETCVTLRSKCPIGF